MARRRRDRKSVLYTQGIAPTKERQQHNGGVVPEAIYEKSEGKTYVRRHRALYESILDAYFWHEVISRPQYLAGQRFGKEYNRSVHKIRVDDGSGNHGDPEMAAISAISGNEVLRKAFAILSRVQRDVVVHVCADNYRAGSTFRRKVLVQALEILAKEWNMLG